MKKTLLGLLAWPVAASAHEGHGLAGAAHWHGTDALGFALGIVAAVAVMWWAGSR
jgi:hypothetical protein